MARASAKSAVTVFHYEEFKNETELRRSFNDYFSNLPDLSIKPFDCPNLRILPASTSIIFKDKPPWIYETEDLICTHGAKNNLSRRCRFGGLNTRDNKTSVGVRWEDGELKLYCPISDIVVSASYLTPKP